MITITVDVLGRYFYSLFTEASTEQAEVKWPAGIWHSLSASAVLVVIKPLKRVTDKYDDKGGDVGKHGCTLFFFVMTVIRGHSVHINSFNFCDKGGKWGIDSLSQFIKVIAEWVVESGLETS